MADNRLRVLVVEDSDDDAVLIIEELRSGGYEPLSRIVSTRDGMRQALSDEPWDVIISDHNLPDFSAIEALIVLLESGKDIPFIIVSGMIGEELAVEAMKSGASDFIMKNSLAKLTPSVANAVHTVNARRMHERAQAEIRSSHEQLRRLTSHLQTVREEERARIAREIHDELGGILTAIKMDIGWIGRRFGQEGELGEKLRSMMAITDGAIKTMRRIITDLRPSVLDDLGLVAAIEWQLREFQLRMGIKTVLDLGLEPDVATVAFGERIAVAAFRIMQESLTNIARHAKATRVVVELTVAEQRLRLTVRDDGVGIDGQQWSKRGSYGILGMHERARGLGGTVELVGCPGKGTEVRLWLPLEPAKEVSA